MTSKVELISVSQERTVQDVEVTENSFYICCYIQSHRCSNDSAQIEKAVCS
jgi:hypothetical protein